MVKGIMSKTKGWNEKNAQAKRRKGRIVAPGF